MWKRTLGERVKNNFAYEIKRLGEPPMNMAGIAFAIAIEFLEYVLVKYIYIYVYCVCFCQWKFIKRYRSFTNINNICRIYLLTFVSQGVEDTPVCCRRRFVPRCCTRRVRVMCVPETRGDGRRPSSSSVTVPKTKK